LRVKHPEKKCPKHLILLITVLLVLNYITLGFCDGQKESRTPIEFSVDFDPVGKPVTDFEGMTTNGLKVSTESMRGKVLLIDLWGINCGSCLDELKALEPLYQSLKEKKFEIWAVNTEQKNKEEINKSLQKHQISVTFPVLVDQEMTITRMFTSWFIPVTVIVDRAGIVQYYKVGFNNSDLEKIQGVLGELLK